MSVRLVMMLSAVVLTLIFPAVLASWLPALRRPLWWLVMGLLVQIGGEFVLMFAGAKAWIPYFEMPFVFVRIIQLFLVLRSSLKLEGREKIVLGAVMILNLVLWGLAGFRLLKIMLPSS